MKLRWVIYQNNITAKQVAAYALDKALPMQEAKRVLQKRTLPVLQVYEDPCLGGKGWVDVPTVVLPHPVTTPATFNGV